MSALRAPLVAGVAGGVGTSTAAAALRARDAERHVARADIVVGHFTGDCLRKLARLADALPAEARPVLAVTAAPGGVRGPLAARLRLLEPRFAGVVVLPHVGAWHELADPLAEAATLLGKPAGRLSRPLRGYADALRALAAAVAASGRLARPAAALGAASDIAHGFACTPPKSGLGGLRCASEVAGAAVRTRTQRLWPGLTAVEHRPRTLHPSAVPADDIAIEEGTRASEPHDVVPLRRQGGAGLPAVGTDG